MCDRKICGWSLNSGFLGNHENFCWLLAEILNVDASVRIKFQMSQMGNHENVFLTLCWNFESWRKRPSTASPQHVDIFSTASPQLLNNFSTACPQLLNNFSTTSRQLLDNFSTASRQLLHSFSTASPQLRSQNLYKIVDFGTRQRCSKFWVHFWIIVKIFKNLRVR